MTTENSAQSIQLSEVNPTPEKKENFLEKGVKRFVGFIAKATGQPDPERWTASTSSATPSEGGNSEAASPGFFDKLVSSTQNLLNKTEEFANKAAEKTKNLTQTIREAPGKVVEKTNTMIDKGINLGEKVKSRAETAVKSGVDFGKNLKNTMVEGAQKFTEPPPQATGDIGKGVVSATGNFWKEVADQTKDLASSSLEHAKEGAKILGDEVKNAGQQLHIDEEGLMKVTPTNLIGEMKEKGKDALEKTKSLWKNIVDNTTDLLKNPVEHLDSLTGKGTNEAPKIETESENTTALDNLEKQEEKAEEK